METPSPVRRLEDITYLVIEDPAEISDYLQGVLKKEWDAEIADGSVPERNWLADLEGRSWELQILDMADVHGSEYLQSEELKRRRSDLIRAIETFGSPIWPIVVWAERKYLVDGYCRYTALRDIGVRTVYAYVGSKE